MTLAAIFREVANVPVVRSPACRCPPLSRSAVGERRAQALADQSSVLFVCLGNICRSPLAPGVTEHLA